MSLAIDVDKISEILLSDGKWHQVEIDDREISSAAFDAFEFVWYGDKRGRGEHADWVQPKAENTGLEFIDECCNGKRTYAALNHILGVRTMSPTDENMWGERQDAKSELIKR